MTASRTDVRPLPEVHEPLVLRCGHHLTEEITMPMTPSQCTPAAADPLAADPLAAAGLADLDPDALTDRPEHLVTDAWLAPATELALHLLDRADPGTLAAGSRTAPGHTLLLLAAPRDGHPAIHLRLPDSSIPDSTSPDGTTCAGPWPADRTTALVPLVGTLELALYRDRDDVDHDEPQYLRTLDPGQVCLLHAGATTRLTGSPDSAQLIASHAPASTQAPTPAPGTAPLTPDEYRAAAADAHARLTGPRPTGAARAAAPRLEDIPDLRAADLPRIHAESDVLHRLAADRGLLSYLVTTTVLAPERYEASRTTLLLDRLVLSTADDLGYEIRLNTNPRPGNQLLPHDHAYPFAARVLTGGYLHTVFLRTDGRTHGCADGRADDRADGPFTSGDLRPAVTTTELPGSSYTLAPTLVHRAVMLPGTTTLMLRGPYRSAAHAASDLVPPVSAWPPPVGGEAPAHSRRMTDAEHHALYRSLAAAGVIDPVPERR
ncbi:hypothetical protein [Kitasatospora sp. NPDC005856]|uniref:hypothetical protein n=1 Tax=Kitasatospora sp. NPDC005856 TaxID=3154566 RepID=UPI0033DC8425